MLRKYFQRSLLFHVIIYLSPKCLKKNWKSEENRLFQKTRIQTMLDKSPWDSTAIFILFCYFSVPSLNSSAFSKFSCSSPSPHPIQSWNSEKNSGYTRPTLFVGWGEGLYLCELENAPEMQKCPKTFVHDWRPYYGICALFVVHLAWCVRGFKNLKRFWPYLIAFSSCIWNGKLE